MAFSKMTMTVLLLVTVTVLLIPFIFVKCHEASQKFSKEKEKRYTSTDYLLVLQGQCT